MEGYCLAPPHRITRLRGRDGEMGGGEGQPDREGVGGLNLNFEFYFDDDGFRPWANLPTGPLSMHIQSILTP